MLSFFLLRPKIYLNKKNIEKPFKAKKKKKKKVIETKFYIPESCVGKILTPYNIR